MARSIAPMCNKGDLSLTWDAKDDETIKPLLQKLLDDGVAFFVVIKRKHAPVTKITQATDARNIVLPTEAWRQLLASSVVNMMATTIAFRSEEETTGETAHTVDEIIENDTVAVNPPQGG